MRQDKVKSTAYMAFNCTSADGERDLTPAYLTVYPRNQTAPLCRLPPRHTFFQVKTTQSYEMSLAVAPKHEVRHRGPVAPRRGAFCQSGKTQAHCSGARAIYVNGNSPSFPVFVLGTD